MISSVSGTLIVIRLTDLYYKSVNRITIKVPDTKIFHKTTNRGFRN